VFDKRSSLINRLFSLYSWSLLILFSTRY